MKLKTEIKQLAGNDIGVALAKLRTYISEESTDFNDCIIMESRFRKLKRDRLRNTEASESIDQRENKLLIDVIEFIDDLVLIEKENEPLNAKKEIVFFEKILVCCTAARKTYMKQFFSKYYFKNIIYYDPDAKSSMADVDLIVFDDPSPNEESKALLKSMLDANNYVLYFGARLPLPIAEYGNRAYFANSIFSLYARIKEMLDFLKYINPK